MSIFPSRKSPYKTYGSRRVRKNTLRTWHRVQLGCLLVPAMINDQIKTNRCFLGNSEALSSNLKSF